MLDLTIFEVTGCTEENMTDVKIQLNPVRGVAWTQKNTTFTANNQNIEYVHNCLPYGISMYLTRQSSSSGPEETLTSGVTLTLTALKLDIGAQS